MQCVGRGVQRNNQAESKGIKFEEVLNRVDSNIKFSKHAEDRLKCRSVELDRVQLQKMELALEKAHKKGVKEALLLMDDMAFIADTKSKTIITTVPKENMVDSIFTNIDGAVII